MANEFQLNLEKNNNKIQEILSYFVGNGVVKVSNYCTEEVDAFEKDCTQRLGTLFNN